MHSRAVSWQKTKQKLVHKQSCIRRKYTRLLSNGKLVQTVMGQLSRLMVQSSSLSCLWWSNPLCVFVATSHPVVSYTWIINTDSLASYTLNSLPDTVKSWFLKIKVAAICVDATSSNPATEATWQGNF